MINFQQVVNNEDYKILEELAKEIWEEHYTPIIGKKQVDYMLARFQSVNAISEQISKDGYIYYIINDGAKNIGYIGFQPKENELFLSKIYIKSSCRGKGYGKEAMNFIIEATIQRGLKKIRLTVNKDNSNSIKAYERMGFKNVNSVVTDIGCGFVMDDYIMEKTI